VAMHLGQGRRAVDLAREAIDRMAVTGSSIDEARVQLALGYLQVGDADDALAALEGLDVPSSPFALGVRSLVLAALGDLDAAMVDVERVSEIANPSYFAVCLAVAAGAAVATRVDAPDAAERVERAAAMAASTGDVVLAGFLRAVVDLLDRPDATVPPADPRRERPLADGWRSVAEMITGTAG
jgi:hypothetical protein